MRVDSDKNLDFGVESRDSSAESRDSRSKKRKRFAFFVAILCAILLDQAVKFCILSADSNPIFTSKIIDIILVYNRGVAFSFLSALGESLKWIILAMLLLMLLIVLKSDELFNAHFCALGVILGAGFSNLLDRFAHGGVVDYIFWHYGFNFAVFNAADTMINLAIAWMILCYIIPKRARFTRSQ